MGLSKAVQFDSGYTDKNPEVKLKLARFDLFQKSPFFASVIMGLDVKVDLTQEFMWTDGISLGYHPDFIHDLSRAELVGILAHEASHICNLHHLRQNNRQGEMWNIACDFAINQDLLNADFTLPDGALVKSDFNGLNSEQIYNVLFGNQQKDDSSNAGQSAKSGDSGDSGDSGNSENQEENGESDSDGDSDGDNDSDSDGDSGQSDKPDSDDSGNDESDKSGQSDKPDESESDSDSNGSGSGSSDSDDSDKPDESDSGKSENFGGCGCFMKPKNPETGKPLNQEELKAATDKLKQEIFQAAIGAKMAGKGSAGIDRTLDEISVGKLAWRELLRQYVKSNVKTEANWSVRNRRYIPHGIYMPGYSNPGINDLIVAIDTSGSINKEMLTAFLSELSQIMTELNLSDVEIVHCDYEVNHTERITSANQIKDIVPVGGGGTSFQPVFDYINESGKQPELLIYFTDGYGDQDELEQVNYPVLWVLWEKHYYFDEYIKPLNQDCIVMD